jgi:predicted nucleotidyltransferase
MRAAPSEQSVSRGPSKRSGWKRPPGGAAALRAPIVIPQPMAPWQQRAGAYGFSSKGLDDEIADFIQHVQLRPAEVDARNAMVARVDACAKQLWADATTSVFGSFSFGLALSTSDVDVAVVGVAAELPELHKLATALEEKSAWHVEVYGFAKVPVIKVFDPTTAIMLDISLTAPFVSESVAAQRAWMAALGEGVTAKASAAIMLTKVLLRQWDLNNVFDGGLSSTSLYLLFERFLSVRERRANEKTAADEPVSRLLLDFWAYVCHDRHTFGFLLYDRNDKANEVSRGTHRVAEILTLLKHASATLTTLAQRGTQQLHPGMPLTILSAVVCDPRPPVPQRPPAAAAVGVADGAAVAVAAKPAKLPARSNTRGHIRRPRDAGANIIEVR